MAKTGVLHFAPWQCCQSGVGADVGNMCVSAGALSGRFDVCEGCSSRLRYLTRGIRPCTDGYSVCSTSGKQLRRWRCLDAREWCHCH